MSARATQLRAPARAGRQPQRRALKVVRRKDKSLIRRALQRRLAPLFVLLGVAFVAAVATVLLAQVMIAQSGFKMAQLRTDIQKAEARHAELVLKAAKLSSSERIERVATQRLGMVEPQRWEYIVADVPQRGRRMLAADPRMPLLQDTDGASALGEVAP